MQSGYKAVLFMAAGAVLCMTLILMNGRMQGMFQVVQQSDAPSYYVVRDPGESQFVLKPELSCSTVIKQTETGWSSDDASCEGDTSFVKAKYNSPGGPMTLFVHPADKDVYVSKTIIIGKIWESEHVHKIYNILRDNPKLQFLDIGGNIGGFGMAAAKLGRRVLMVEPQLTNVRKLCNSIRAGNFREVKVMHNALSSQRMRVGFKPWKNNNGGYKVRNVTSEEEETAYAALLDDVLNVFNFTAIVMKMDIEGHEHKVLKAAEKFFTRVDVRYLLMEWYKDKDVTGKAIIDFLTRHKMVPYNSLKDNRLDVNQYKTKSWYGEVFWRKVD